jgi:hypothetical protein
MSFASFASGNDIICSAVDDFISMRALSETHVYHLLTLALRSTASEYFFSMP